MVLPPDWSEFIGVLISHRVDFVVVGGHAVGFHGYPRFTGDIDFLIRPTRANTHAVVEVLDAFGFGRHEHLADELTQPGKVVQLGRPPSRIDLLSSISGVLLEEAFADTSSGDLGGHAVRMLGREALLRNKRATGRLKDLADVDELERVALAAGPPG
jgi:hypothetical protein